MEQEEGLSLQEHYPGRESACYHMISPTTITNVITNDSRHKIPSPAENKKVVGNFRSHVCVAKLRTNHLVFVWDSHH